jgi:hypothetical protein
MHAYDTVPMVAITVSVRQIADRQVGNFTLALRSIGAE